MRFFITSGLWGLLFAFIGSPTLAEDERKEVSETLEPSFVHLVTTPELASPLLLPEKNSLSESYRALLEIFPEQNSSTAIEEVLNPTYSTFNEEKDESPFRASEDMERIFRKDNNHLFRQAVEENLEKAMAWMDRVGNGLLHFAVIFQNQELVSLLVDKGFSINSKNSLGYTPYLLSIINTNLDLLQFFLDHPQTDLTVTNSFGDNAFHTVFTSLRENRTYSKKIAERSKMLELMLSEKYREKMLPLLNQSDKKGNLPISFAFRDFDTPTLKWIIANEEAGNWTKEAQDGNSLLHVAVLALSLESLKFILKRTFLNINGQNKNGDTPLHLAVEMLNEDPSLKLSEDILTFLFSQDEIDLNIRNNRGERAYDIAAYPAVREIFIQADKMKKSSKRGKRKKRKPSIKANEVEGSPKNKHSIVVPVSHPAIQGPVLVPSCHSVFNTRPKK